MPPAAREYEDAAAGARSALESQRRQIPALEGSNGLVKFDGLDGNVLIDRKRAVTTFPKSKNQALRQSQALLDNGLEGRWEVPSEAEARRALKLFEELGIQNISVRIVL